ncbi:hypothetical protein BDV95DRAFT_621997 [Massariosphaeria phaeospora]|uniref:HAD-like domain-containing protein n=1 Tax=Massariosphaeria phaeospora TaxID=100035 RepID=A0A7C8I2L3_9PLEO|nr:hypothetical protein BDV95DRAFT_621997 [Massariosphaeria phaeospora]
MASSPLPPPKAILFDIGGVCVLSPFQAILDYEREHFIPTGYINSAIQRGPLDTGAWQMLERGEAVLGDEWFAAFRAQLEDKGAWRAFWEHGGGRKNETAPASIQTPIPPPTIDAKVLFWRMMRMARTPDPHIFPALRRLRASGRFVLGALSNTVAFPEGVVDDTGALFSNELEHHPDSDNTNNDLPTAPATPPTDIRAYFDVFISSAHVGVRKPDARAYEMAVRELDRKLLEHA